MFKREHRVVAACADTVFPPAGPIPVSGTDAGVVGYVEQYLSGLSFGTRCLIRLLFLFIQLSPLVFGPRHARFTKLTSHEQSIVFGDMKKSSIYFRRAAYVSMQFIVTLGYFANAQVESTITNQEDEVQK